MFFRAAEESKKQHCTRSLEDLSLDIHGSVRVTLPRVTQITLNNHNTNRHALLQVIKVIGASEVKLSGLPTSSQMESGCGFCRVMLSDTPQSSHQGPVTMFHMELTLPQHLGFPLQELLPDVCGPTLVCEWL